MSKMIGFFYASNACLILNLNMRAPISTAARGKNLSNLLWFKKLNLKEKILRKCTDTEDQKYSG
jgi:hypothetical protein